MRKSLFMAMVMAVVLSVYGYFVSAAGHDHSQHDQKTEHDHSDHSH